MKCLILLLLLSASAGAATKLYKSVDENGHVTFSDSAPAGVSRAEAIDIPEDEANILPSATISDQMEQQQKEDEQAARVRQQSHNDWSEQYDRAALELEEAERELEQAQQIREGDIVGSAFGGARPNADWVERLEQAENTVQLKQEALDKIKRAR